MQRLIFLDGWRGLAILAVLVGHFLGLLSPVNMGRFGVELFFVLSGRLMGELLFVRKTPLGTFFPRRATRIYPALLVVIAVVSALSWSVLPSLGVTVGAALSAATMTANYYSIYVGRVYSLDHIWSLCVEEHLYILLGALAFVHRRWPFPLIPVLGGLAGLAMLNGALQSLAGLDYYQVYWRSDVRGASILLGAVAFLLLDGRKVPPLLPFVAGGLGLVFSLGALPDMVKYSLGSTCLAVAVATLPSLSAMAHRALSLGPLVWLGLLSYSLYLVQQPFYALANGPLQHLAVLPLVLGLGFLSHRFVEAPAREWLNARLVRRPRPAAVAVAASSEPGA